MNVVSSQSENVMVSLVKPHACDLLLCWMKLSVRAVRAGHGVSGVSTGSRSDISHQHFLIEHVVTTIDIRNIIDSTDGTDQSAWAD